MRPLTRTAGLVARTLVLLVTLSGPALAQTTPTVPVPPDFASFAGWRVFSEAGCGGCHVFRGIGSGGAPDLARIDAASFYDLGARMWNHLPRMGARMTAQRVQRPRLTPDDVTNLLGFLFTARYFDDTGDPKAGERLFTAKGCATCHQVAGKGGSVGPSLDTVKGVNSPVILAAQLWNHGPQMAERMQAAGITRPTFAERELEDLVAYILAESRGGTPAVVQVRPGRPDVGAMLLTSKQCTTCHRVRGEGGTIGPALGPGGRRQHVDLAGFVARMWNHGPRMWAEMKRRAIDVPQLSGQEMADLLAYLYVTDYTGPAGSANRGLEVVQQRGCTGCHAVNGRGGRVGPDLARSQAGATPSALVAAMWNHSFAMQVQAERQNVQWPTLSAQNLSDVAAYLRSLARPAK